MAAKAWAFGGMASWNDLAIADEAARGTDHVAFRLRFGVLLVTSESSRKLAVSSVGSRARALAWQPGRTQLSRYSSSCRAARSAASTALRS